VPDVAALAVQLGLSPGSHALRQALTHSSYVAEHDGESNERLEFLGDAVVDLAVADYIVGRFPLLNEGAASVLRSRVVNEDSLADVARRLHLGDLLRLGRGVLKEKGHERRRGPSLGVGHRRGESRRHPGPQDPTQALGRESRTRCARLRSRGDRAPARCHLRGDGECRDDVGERVGSVEEARRDQRGGRCLGGSV